MLDDFDKACGKIGLRLNLTKTMFMENELVSHVFHAQRNEYFRMIQLCLSREINTVSDLLLGLSRRKRAAWGAFKGIEDVLKRTKNTRICPHLFVSTGLPALTYVSETWSLRKQDEGSVSVMERAVERTVLGVSRSTQGRYGIRSPDLRQRPKIKDAVLYARQSKIMWAGHVMRMNDNRWTRAVSC
ncbi:unnamed protein product [Angiostrongylus costaricensis]|uniref:Reverse transcriptase domain-containing protein n=1 Tax=Angiostrongylus costaricensis TaxID=334426 RepID=A0A0R3PMH0_ANGCS|nr:unnamed protein product [Angiostrongylus costaricensis]